MSPTPANSTKLIRPNLSLSHSTMRSDAQRSRARLISAMFMFGRGEAATDGECVRTEKHLIYIERLER